MNRSEIMYLGSMRKSFKDSIKVLEADIQHANTMATDLRREYDGGSVQLRMSYSAAAQFLLFFVQWSDCHLAGALGLLTILIYKNVLQDDMVCHVACKILEIIESLLGCSKLVYVDGTTTMSTHERKASIREFYGIIYPSLIQLQSGVTNLEDKKQKNICIERYVKREEDDDGSRCLDLDIESEDKKQKKICIERYAKREEDDDGSQCSDLDIESEDKKQKKICIERYAKREEDDDGSRCSDLDIESEECGICMEANDKLVLPNCSHAMCSNCYNDWRTRSLSCPFCRVSLKRIEPEELWVYVDKKEAVDMTTITRENLKRFFMYVDKLPLMPPNSLFDAYDSLLR